MQLVRVSVSVVARMASAEPGTRFSLVSTAGDLTIAAS